METKFHICSDDDDHHELEVKVVLGKSEGILAVLSLYLKQLLKKHLKDVLGF